MLAALGEALGYFTILPVPAVSRRPPSPDAVALLPLVGALVGATSGAAAYGAARVAPRPIANALAYALPIALTGALHVDGFLDTCDALFAQVSPERRREILRDPRHGTFAVAAQSIATVIGYASVSALAPKRLPAAAALAEGTGRLAALGVALDAAHAPGTAGGAFTRPPNAPLVFAQGVGLTVLALRIGGPALALAVPATAFGARIASRRIARAFGGTLSGDVYGFTIVTASLAMLALATCTNRDAK